MNHQNQISPAEIVDARARLCLTQVELGEKIGVSGSKISRWETGHEPVGKRHISAVRRMLRIAKRAESMPKVASPDSELTDEDLRFREALESMIAVPNFCCVTCGTGISTTDAAVLVAKALQSGEPVNKYLKVKD